MFEEIPTPSFLVDRVISESNCTRMRNRSGAGSARLRPHVKTHKTIEGARLQLGAACGPVTVSTLSEAELFAAGGFRDITWAVPVAPAKLERFASIAARVDALNLLVDNPEAIVAIEELGVASGRRFDVFLKVDCGYHRAGVDPESRQAIDLARRLAESDWTRFRGILTHAGHAYHARSVDEIREIAIEEAACLTRFADRLREAGVVVEVRSIGSTPTCSVVDRLPAVEEARPGNYIFYDGFQSSIGSCTLDDIAASVLVSVIGVYRDKRTLLIDAGSLAMSKDRGAEHDGSDPGYGILCDLDRRPIAGLHLEGLSQEHGHVRVGAALEMDRFHVGTRLRVVPNHSCLTAALFDRYYVIEGGAVVDVWRPARGW